MLVRKNRATLYTMLVIGACMLMMAGCGSAVDGEKSDGSDENKQLQTEQKVDTTTAIDDEKTTTEALDSKNSTDVENEPTVEEVTYLDYSDRVAEAEKNIFWHEPDLIDIYETIDMWNYFDKDWDGALPMAIIQNDEMKYVFINDDGKIVDNDGKIAPDDMYDMIFDISDERIVVVKVINEEWLYGAVDKDGKLVVPCKYSSIGEFKDGVAVASIYKDDKFYFGFIDKDGNELTECKYTDLDNLEDGIAAASMAVEIDGESVIKAGFVDKHGKEVIPFNYSDTYNFSEELAIVINVIDDKNNWSYIDKDANEVISLGDKYNDVGNFSDGYAYVSIENEADGDKSLYGFIDKTGELVIPCIYDYVDGFEDGRALVMVDVDDSADDDYKFGYINTKGESIIAAKYDWMEESKDDMYIVGNIVEYEENEEQAESGLEADAEINAEDVAESATEIAVDDAVDGEEQDEDEQAYEEEYEEYEYGVIDMDGNEIIPCKYSYIDSFSEGLSYVYIPKCDDYEVVYINKNGEKVITGNYDDAQSFRYGIGAVSDKDDFMWRYINKKGQVVSDNSYDLVTKFIGGRGFVQKGSSVGFINLNK